MAERIGTRTGTRRLVPLIAGFAALALLLAACGGSDGAGAGADATSTGTGGTDSSDSSGSAEMVTLAETGLSPSIRLPGDIPMPSDAVIAGENPLEGNYSTVQFSTSIPVEELIVAVQDFAASEPNARFDEAISQALFEREIDGTRHTVYLFPRSLDTPTLEVGAIPNPG